MDITLTLESGLSLFGAMLVLALVPGLSVVTVCARAAAFGLRHGVLAALGIVAGDIVYILIVVLGLAALADGVPGLTAALGYAGGAYLVWLGLRTWRARARPAAALERVSEASAAGSFLAGLLLTLADQKAVLFYLVFLPAFLDLSRATPGDAVLVAAIAAVAVGGAKLAYAILADRARTLPGAKFAAALNGCAAAVQVGAGIFLILRG